MRRRRSYVERSLAANRRLFVKANWRRLLVVLALWVTVGAFVSVLVGGYARGFLHGLLAASFLTAIYAVFILGTGQTFRLAGKWGEENTRDILRWGRRRGHILDWVDNLEIEGGDVDHLVIGKSGLFAVDSKWHGHTVTSETVRLDRLRAEASARRARSIMRSLHVQHEVRPIVVVWGGQQTRMSGPSRPEGDTLFLPGRDLKNWLRTQSDGNIIGTAEGRDIASRLKRFRHRVQPK